MGALAGKAAGVQINSSASGPGGGVKAVSYTHLDVYKRQVPLHVLEQHR